MGCRPGEGHGEGLDGDRVEVEDARVEVDGRQRAARDDHSLELLEHRPHRQTGIQAAQLRTNHIAFYLSHIAIHTSKHC
jgi:hypothetical protein